MFHPARGAVVKETFGTRSIPFCIDLEESTAISFGGRLATISRFGFAGCQGVTGKIFKRGGTSRETVQKEIGSQLRAMDLDCVFLLGDNFYDDGIGDVRGARFTTCFDDIYPTGERPVFMVLGNHDYNLHSHGDNPLLSSGAKSPSERMTWALTQVQRTYYLLQARHTSKWTMPYRYYALFSRNLHFIILDSNTYPFDAFQQQWLEDVCGYSLKRGKGNVLRALIMHHPVIARGKRAASLDDKNRYAATFGAPLEDSRARRGLRTNSMSDYMYNSLVSLNTRNLLVFDFILCAHDHLTSSEIVRIGNREVLQVISGGGGGNLEDEKKVEKSDAIYDGQVDKPELEHLIGRLEHNEYCIIQHGYHVATVYPDKRIRFQCMGKSDTRTAVYSFKPGERVGDHLRQTDGRALPPEIMTPRKERLDRYVATLKNAIEQHTWEFSVFGGGETVEVGPGRSIKVPKNVKSMVDAIKQYERNPHNVEIDVEIQRIASLALSRGSAFRAADTTRFYREWSTKTVDDCIREASRAGTRRRGLIIAE